MKKNLFILWSIFSFVITFIAIGLGVFLLYYRIMPNVAYLIGLIGFITSDVFIVLNYKSRKKTEEYKKKLKELGWL